MVGSSLLFSLTAAALAATASSESTYSTYLAKKDLPCDKGFHAVQKPPFWWHSCEPQTGACPQSCGTCKKPDYDETPAGQAAVCKCAGADSDCTAACGYPGMDKKKNCVPIPCQQKNPETAGCISLDGNCGAGKTSMCVDAEGTKAECTFPEPYTGVCAAYCYQILDSDKCETIRNMHGITIPNNIGVCPRFAISKVSGWGEELDPDPTEQPTESGDCADVTSFEDNKGVIRDCGFVGKNTANRCKKYSTSCPVTCGICTDAPTEEPTDQCADVASFEDNKGVIRDCGFVGKNTANRCKKYSNSCPVTCGTCGDVPGARRMAEVVATFDDGITYLPGEFNECVQGIPPYEVDSSLCDSSPNSQPENPDKSFDGPLPTVACPPHKNRESEGIPAFFTDLLVPPDASVTCQTACACNENDGFGPPSCFVGGEPYPGPTGCCYCDGKNIAYDTTSFDTCGHYLPIFGNGTVPSAAQCYHDYASNPNHPGLVDNYPVPNPYTCEPDETAAPAFL